MRPELADRLLRAAMGKAADQDFPDQLGLLRSLAAYKYNDYQQYTPGHQFIESLALWLDQFQDDEKRAALAFIRERLIYMSDDEMRHLVALMARVRVPDALREQVAQKLDIPKYRVSALRASTDFQRSLRASLFLGMSDGARMDQFRRNNSALSNEQFATSHELSEPRVESMITKLRQDLEDPNAVFTNIFLVDDFAGSGTTIIRRNEKGHLDGRLYRFVKHTLPELTNANCPQIFILLYLATSQALTHIRTMIRSYPCPPWSRDNVPGVIAVMEVGDTSCLRHCRHSTDYKTDRMFDRLLHQYYDPAIKDEHKGDVLHGFLDCGLPLVLPHNTPNNSVYLLWAQETTVPLFPRFERHTSRMTLDA